MKIINGSENDTKSKNRRKSWRREKINYKDMESKMKKIEKQRKKGSKERK